eukprot:SAG31_NODE_469_length_15244_cov_11.537141_7_plen_100_part_00
MDSMAADSYCRRLKWLEYYAGIFDPAHEYRHSWILSAADQLGAAVQEGLQDVLKGLHVQNSRFFFVVCHLSFVYVIVFLGGRLTQSCCRHLIVRKYHKI